MKKSEAGFSLVELTVATGLLGLLAVVVVYGVNQMGLLLKESRQNEVIRENLAEGVRNIKKSVSSGLFYRKFNANQTYNNKLSLVNWPVKNLDVEDLDKLKVFFDLLTSESQETVELFRNSHTLIGEKSVFLSRCVPKSIYNSVKKEMTISDINSFDKVPFVTTKGVYCCLIGSRKKCSVAAISPGSDDRVMSFKLTKGRKPKSFPAASDKRAILGSGFIIMIDDGADPRNYSYQQFVLSDPCYKRGNKENCDIVGVVNVRTGSGEVSSARSIHDTGHLIIE